MRLPLLCHPDMPCGPLTGIDVEVARQGTRAGLRRIALRFVATGNVKAVEVPWHVTRHGRKDELWRHTCFEAFVRVGGSSAYHEFNLAPSGDWNCYRFAAHREAMALEKQAGDPGIQTYVRQEPLSPEQRDGIAAAGMDPLDRFDTPFFTLTATLELQSTLLPVDEPWHVGLSAVIEERNGRLSYWALAHPPGKPDFHHPDCFTLELPAPRKP